ncbi:MAG: ADOP family duplicated permease [Candidatus Sulfopaludibacter sp.]|nr:ADOP family duplicated permease [Candidatus Sulfopaludibacter sp.]
MSVAAHYLRAACRTLSRRRGAYLFPVAILALGIGMSAAMFSLVDAVLLRPLPFPRQDSIQVIWKKDPPAGMHVEELAYPELRDLQENIRDFQYVALMPTSLYGYGRVLRTAKGEPVQIEGAPVSHDFFRVLGVSPALGRDFTASDEQVGAPPVVVLSDRVWRGQLGADPHIVGRMIALNGQGHTVIGVMARGVEFPRGAGLWFPLGVDRRVVESRRATFLQAIARTRPGAPSTGIAAQVNALFTRLAKDHPDAYSPSQQGVVTPLFAYWTGSARLHLWIMLAASCLLLAAALISAGNLFLSRAIARRQEIATRIAIGAGRAQIAGLFAAEGAIAGIFAAAGGLAIAQWAVQFLVKFAPADIPRLSGAALHWGSFCFAAVASILAAMACSVLPAWFATQPLMPTGNRSPQRAFLFAQSAVTVTLLAMSAFLVLSYRSLLYADTGFANRDALSMNLALRGPSRRAFYTRLLERLREQPGVISAAGVLVRPLEGPIGWDVPYQFEFEAGKDEGRDLPKANYEVVTPGYFQTVGTRLLEGRDFTDRDADGAEGVIIISRVLAQQIRRAGHPPLGYRMRIGLASGWLKVIGIAADARYRNIAQTGADLFVPYLQAAAPTNYIVIRGTRPAGELATLVRRILAAMDPTQAIAGVATIGELIDRNTARHRFNMILLLWFAACAAVLAATGIYSVIAESVAARRREIAIRNALGAGRARLVRDIVSAAMAFVLAGEGAGIACAVTLGTEASDLLYGVSPHDPAILGAVIAFLFAVSLASAFYPAWIASRDVRFS